MKIWIKIGTHAADVLSMGRRQKLPVVGERFGVRERSESARMTEVYCDMIKIISGRPLYYVSR